MNEPGVDVVIVNWNSGGYLADCIRSLDALDQHGYRIASVSIIDNASTDGSADVGATRMPIRVVRNARNLGFGAACNIGARIGRAELILFLNPDARLEASSLGASVPRLCENAAIWVVGAQLIDESGRIQRTCCRAPSGPRMFAHALGIDRLLPATGYVMTGWPHDETRFVDHVIGAFYLIRRDAFEQLGGFDERFFVYLEDLDLSMRVRDAGGRCLYVTEAVAHHAGGGTTRSIKATRLFYSVRSRLQFAVKHFSVLWVVAVWTASLTVEPLLRVAAALVHRSAKELGEVRHAYGQLLRWIVR